jgi:glycerol kinase
MNTGSEAVRSQNGLITTIAAGAGEEVQYALEGSVFVAGAAVRWPRDEMKLIHDSSDSEYFARKVKDSGGVYFVPAFAGLGAPYWDMEARGTIVGMTGGTSESHIIRATLESIAYQTEDVIAAMREDIKTINNGNDVINDISHLKVDGGASANELLMQTQSDISNISVVRSANAEATAAGAAYLAGLAVGFFKDRAEIKSKIGVGKVFEPEMNESERIEKLDGWHRAVRACQAFCK